jgi:ribosomal subunit interface protein
MNIKHFEKGFHLNDRELLIIARKIGKLATYCKRIKDEASSIRVESEYRRTEKKRDQMKIMITIELPKKTLRAESRRPDVNEGVDRCIEKLVPQVVKYKEMHSGRGKNRASRKRK